MFESQHAAIIERTLRWADQAAARDDYAEALRWVETVRSLGEALPEHYEAKRRTWRRLASAVTDAHHRPGITGRNPRRPI